MKDENTYPGLFCNKITTCKFNKTAKYHTIK